jgi:PAS domain S-box-containing protein
VGATDGFYKAAFDAAPDAIVVFDDEGNYVYVNKLAAAMYGMTRDELAGRRIGDFTTEPEKTNLDAFWTALRSEKVIEGRHRIVAPDGSERVVSFKTRADFVPGRHITVFRQQAGPRTRLSRREQQVMQMLAHGHNGPSIAEQLVISPETVRTHVRNAMEKLGAKTRAHAIALAAAYGEITVEAA